MAAAKTKARTKKKPRAQIKALARGKFRVSPPARSRTKPKAAARPKQKVVVSLYSDLTPYALDVLDEIEACRETLSGRVAKGFLSSETAEHHRYVLTYLARRINAKGCRNKTDLQKMCFTFGDRAEKLQAKTKLPIPAGTLARRRWHKACVENREKALEAMQQAIYARNLYHQITCEEMPTRPAVLAARAAAAALAA